MNDYELNRRFKKLEKALALQPISEANLQSNVDPNNQGFKSMGERIYSVLSSIQGRIESGQASPGQIDRFNRMQEILENARQRLETQPGQ